MFNTRRVRHSDCAFTAHFRLYDGARPLTDLITHTHTGMRMHIDKTAFPIGTCERVSRRIQVARKVNNIKYCRVIPRRLYR